MSAAEAWFLSVADGRRRGVLPSMTRGALSCLAGIYRVGLEAYLLPYAIGIRRRTRLSCPVVCIGNLTVGGTGKTPMTQTFCRLLQAQGLSVVVLSRGYGGRFERGCAVVSDTRHVRLNARDAGDEAHLLAKTLPGIPVVVGKDRRVTGRLAIEEFEPDLLVMDDGMQFWQLHRDIDVALVNACKPFDNGWTLPRGLLREPPSHLRRASIVILTHAERAGEEQVRSVRRRVARLAPGKPLYTADLAPLGLRTLGANEEIELDWLKGRRVAALSAIGSPDSFEGMLANLGADLAARYRFRDHQAISIEEFGRVSAGSIAANAEAIVTTEKDAVKLSPLPSGLPVYVLQVTMRVHGERDFLTTVWETVVASQRMNRA